MYPALGNWIKAPLLNTAVNIKIDIVCSFYNRLFLPMIILTDLPYTCSTQNLSPLNTGDQTQAVTPMSNLAPYPSLPELFPQTNLWMFAIIIVMAHVGSFYSSAASSAVQLAVTLCTHPFTASWHSQLLGLHTFSWHAMTFCSNGASPFLAMSKIKALLFIWLIVAFNKKTLNKISKSIQQVLWFLSLVLSESYWLDCGTLTSLKIILHNAVCHFHIHTPLPNYSTLFFLTEYNMLYSSVEMLINNFYSLPICTAQMLYFFPCSVFIYKVEKPWLLVFISFAKSNMLYFLTIFSSIIRLQSLLLLLEALVLLWGFGKGLEGKP